MKTICLYFEIHQIIHLKRYRFFNIGTDHYYYDDYENERSITEVAERSYIPALKTLIEMAREHGDYFKVAISISGVALEQLEIHAPMVCLHWLMKSVSGPIWNVCARKCVSFSDRRLKYAAIPA